MGHWMTDVNGDDYYVESGSDTDLYAQTKKFAKEMLTCIIDSDNKLRCLHCPHCRSIDGYQYRCFIIVDAMDLGVPIEWEFKNT